jgi:hypothetical protein
MGCFLAHQVVGHTFFGEVQIGFVLALQVASIKVRWFLKKSGFG